MTDHCQECDFDYAEVTTESAAVRLRTDAGNLGDTVLAVGAAPCPTPGCWTAIEYGGHVRDMLIVQRERILHARTADTPPIIPMGRDERVGWGEYTGLTAADIARQLHDTADSLARTLEHLSPEEWRRRVVYNYPERAERTLEWVAAHTVHEIVHHTMDVRRHRSEGSQLP
ncbi:DinB family protein [Microlunatus soli]|uniref:DinB superfamily protein n=1 Tax=Microlunatus soli TaxID=630515 RepID=A0A1H1QTI7_9ACTN|nr:DinB family protein [Microlunatus soli]SDS26686.1 DinB superfamily protein [Microlunatus soli]